MGKKTLILQAPGSATGTGYKKLENFVGIEFERGASDGGGTNGYHKMIGDETLLKTLPLFNQIHLASVLNAEEEEGDINWTGSDGSDVMQVFPHTYAILGGSDPTYERWIYSDSPFSYKGDTAVDLGSWAEAPDYEVILNGIARSVVTTNATATWTRNAAISNFTDDRYANGNGFPSVWINRYSYEAYARAKNEDNTKNYPYCNANNIDLEAVLGMLYVECRTKDITKVFGYGVSSDVFPNADNWADVSGFRITDASGNVTFATFGSNVYIGKTAVNIWTAINGQNSLLKALEVQKAIADGTVVLAPVTDVDGNVLGGHTGIFKMDLQFNLSGSTKADGDDETLTVQMHLRVPVWRDRSNLYGNIWTHLSGYEGVLTVNSDGKNETDIYRCPSIDLLATDNNTSTPEDQETLGFPFVKTYHKIGTAPQGSGWAKETMTDGDRNSIVGKTYGAAINNYESAYTYANEDNTGTFKQGHYYRRCPLVGGCASYGLCVPRFVSVAATSSNATADFGSRFRVRLTA